MSGKDDFKPESPYHPYDQGKMFAQWALQEAYSMAVKIRGITDWSKASAEDAKLVEDYQIRIAELIMWGVRFP